MVMVNQYAIGRLQFYLSRVEIPQCKLLEIDLTVRRYAKQWLKLPECATDHILYAGTDKGGLSLPRLSQLLTLTPRYFVLSAGDISGSFWPSTSHFGWKSLITYDLFALGLIS
jgi:hypothetical protein